MAEGNIEVDFQAAIDAGKIEGAIICATDGEGRFVYNKTLGERTLLSGEKSPHRLDDVLYLASATKLLASIAALQCVEDGLLSLTGDLSAVAPELSAKKVLTGFSEDGAQTPIVEEQARPVTLEMLLTHSAGATYHFLDPPVGRWRERFATESSSANRKTVEDLIVYPLGFQPGAGWLYGTGLDWAGRMVERVTGKTLGERLRESVYRPLSIPDDAAGFYPISGREDVRPHLVDLNPRDPNCLGMAVLGGSGNMNLITKGDFGGHGGFLTGPGYLAILRSLLTNDGRLLKRETVDDLLFQNRLGPEATADLRTKLQSPAGIFYRCGIPPETSAGFSAGGLLTLEDLPGWYGKRTLSWGGGLAFAWFVDREHDLCGVCAIQATLPDAHGDTLRELKQIFRGDIYRKLAAWKKEQASR